MGAHRTNMVSAKLFCVALLVAVAINLHSTDAACSLPVPTDTAAAAQTSLFQVMTTEATETCAAACTACGMNLGADAGIAGIAAAPSYNTQALMNALGTSLCPNIAYNTAQTANAGDDTACPAGNPRFNVPAVTAQPAAYPTTVNIAGGMTATGQTSCTVFDGTSIEAWTAATAMFGAICACLVDATNTCARTTSPASGGICGCTDFGVPTLAPTGIPTSAPTVVTSSPVSDGSTWSVTGTDNDLSGGAIAGIVIGSIVGAALVIGAGVMIGSK